MNLFNLETLPPSSSISIGYLSSLNIDLIFFVKLCVCLIESIFRENNIIPHGLFFFKKDISLFDNFFP